MDSHRSNLEILGYWRCPCYWQRYRFGHIRNCGRINIQRDWTRFCSLSHLCPRLLNTHNDSLVYVSPIACSARIGKNGCDSNYTFTRDHELHVYRFWHNSRTLHIYLFYVTRYRSRDGPNVPIEGQAMTEEQEDELTNLFHLIVEHLATLNRSIVSIFSVNRWRQGTCYAAQRLLFRTQLTLPIWQASAPQTCLRGQKLKQYGYFCSQFKLARDRAQVKSDELGIEFSFSVQRSSGKECFRYRKHGECKETSGAHYGINDYKIGERVSPVLISGYARREKA